MRAFNQGCSKALDQGYLVRYESDGKPLTRTGGGTNDGPWLAEMPLRECHAPEPDFRACNKTQSALVRGLLTDWSTLRDFSGPIRSAAIRRDLAGCYAGRPIEVSRATASSNKCLGRMKLQTFFDAAHLLICCEPRWAGRDMPVGRLIVRQHGCICRTHNYF